MRVIESSRVEMSFTVLISCWQSILSSTILLLEDGPLFFSCL